jgi:hypothetical protein
MAEKPPTQLQVAGQFVHLVDYGTDSLARGARGAPRMGAGVSGLGACVHPRGSLSTPTSSRRGSTSTSPALSSPASASTTFATPGRPWPSRRGQPQGRVRAPRSRDRRLHARGLRPRHPRNAGRGRGASGGADLRERIVRATNGATEGVKREGGERMFTASDLLFY